MSVFKRGFNRVLKRFGVQVFSVVDMRNEFNRALLRSGRRSPPYSGRSESPDLIVPPAWDYVGLMRLSHHHPVVRFVHEAIIRECTRNWGEVQPNFKWRCDACTHEHQTEVTVCEECGGSALSEPDPLQKKTLEQFIDRPNRDDEWRDIIVSLFRFSLGVSDWYVYVDESLSSIPLDDVGLIGRDLSTRVLQIYVEDSRYIRVAADEKTGRLGKLEFFCPACYNGENDEPVYDANYYRTHDGMCRGPNGKAGCGGELIETCYVWVQGDGAQIRARFGRDEIIHGSSDPQLPHLYGIPKLVAALRPANVLLHMDRFNLEHYATGKTGKLVVFSGVRQEAANQISSDILNQVETRVDRSLTTGQRAAPKISTPFIGLEESDASVAVVDAMPDSEKMQSLEWYQEYIERVCSPYGVTPKFEGIAEAGQAGVRMEIDVSNDTARMYQQEFEEAFRDKLWPRLGVTDWSWLFNPIEERDELLDARILDMNVHSVIAAANAGLDAEMKEDGSVTIAGKPVPGMSTPEEPSLGYTSPETEALHPKESWIVKRMVSKDDASS